MKRLVLVFVSLLLVSGCSQVSMNSSRAKTTATGSAGGAHTENVNPMLERCASPIGTLSVLEEDRNLYSIISRYGMQSTVPVLRLLAQQSNCFVVVERGEGFRSMTTERKLEKAGELRKHSNFGKGQMVAADYTVVPTLVFNDNNTGGVGGAIGGLFGTVGATIGSSLQFKEAQSMLTLVDNRSGVQVAVAEGSGSSMDVGGLFGFFESVSSVGGGMGGYANTPEAKVIVAAMTDAFNNLIRATKNYKPQEATGPYGHGTGGKLKVN